MGIIEMIRKWNENKKTNSNKFKEMQEDARLQKMLEQRQKSSNERELERHMKDKREVEIKEALEQIRKQKTKESWKGDNFQGKATMLKDDRPILKEKNIFKGEKKNMLVDKKNKVPLQNKRKGMFFRW